LATTSDSGASNGDNLTNVSTPTISGTAEANATIKLYDGAVQVGSTVADTNGNWSITASTLGNGVHTLSATATDMAGNTSAASASLDITVDTAAPDVPGTPILAVDTGLSSTDKITSNGTVNVSGLEADATWQYSVNGGSWTDGSCTSVTLSGDGAKSVIVRQIDAAGNVSAASAQLDFTLDTAAPTAPAPTLASDTGASSTDKITSNGTVNVSGLEAGATWQYSVNGGSWTNGSGTSLALSGDGTKSVTVRQIDAAGNISAASAALDFTLDTTAPTAPAAPTLATDSGFRASDKITKNGTVNLSGLDAGATWQYSLNGGTTWTNGSGTSVTLTGDGTKSVTVRQIDAAGNASAASAALDFTLDTTAPTAPAALLANDNGSSATDKITNDGTYNVIGLEADAPYWEVRVNSGIWIGIIGNSTATLSGSDGPKSLVVRQADLAGNISPNSSSLDFTLDTTAPSAPSLALTNDSLVNNDFYTMWASVTASGMESGATLEYTLDGSTWYPTSNPITDRIGSDGTFTMSARQLDAAGNRGSVSAPITFTVDKTAPVPTLSAQSSSVPANGTANFSLTFSENVWDVDAGDFTVSGGTISSITGSGSSYTVAVTAGTSGSLTLRLDAALGAGVHDLAGNNTQASGTATVNIEKSAPVIVSITADANSATELVAYDLDSRPSDLTVDASDWGYLMSRDNGSDLPGSTLRMTWAPKDNERLYNTIYVTDESGAYAWGQYFGPVVLDLTGDGVNLMTPSLDHTTLDTNDDGVRDFTGWAGTGTGILVFDANGDRTLTDVAEVELSRYGATGATDLEGLALGFDSNHDQVFDTRDEQWASFGVWQGSVDDGQYFTLAEMGITSVSLTAAVNGEAVNGSLILGRTSFTWADGRSGEAADVAFGFINGVAADLLKVVIQGTAAADLFAVQARAGLSMRIEGFSSADGDRVVLEHGFNGLNFASAEDVLAVSHQVYGDTVLELGIGQTVTLVGVTALTAEDIVLQG
jgi:hypothetical protein